MNLINISIAILVIAAVLGLNILIKWLSKKEVSRGVIYSHGIFAALGLVVIVVYALQNRSNYPNVALILLIISALGGFYMFFRELRDKMSPYSIAFAHALLAVAGVVSLLIFAFA